MLWRKSKRKMEEQAARLEEEVKRLEQRLAELKQRKKEYEREKRELEKLLEKRRREIDTLRTRVQIGKQVVVLLRQGPGYVKVKGKVTVAGIVFRYMGKKWEVPFDPQHFFYMKHGWFGKPSLTVYVDLDKMYTVPPPDVKVSVEREMDTRAVQAVLTIYRSILFGQRREQLALLAGLLIAVLGMAVAIFAIWQYNHTIQQQLDQLREVVKQLAEILKQYPPTPHPQVPPGG